MTEPTTVTMGTSPDQPVDVVTDAFSGTPLPALRLGTRRSALAVAQSTRVADAVRDLGRKVELVIVVTDGDTSDAPLTSIGGTGVFASALRRALRENEIDLAVHSLKDLPT
ncbi:MAG: hydroxymethylbilane synthase, partial [Nostocoides sp.]